jgi:eukaryotic-like serine/threonine-protein kinase
MSDKPSPKSTAPKAAAKTVGTSSGTKGSAGAGRNKSGEPDEIYEFLDPSTKPDEIGRLAHYRVLRVLGKGGMGTVFMAEDTRLHRIVALKVMLPSIAKKEVARDRFIREARATAKIDHDHIITIYEVNENSEVPYAAMQYLKGMTLEDWLKAGKTLNVPQIMRIGKEIAKGLAAAHAQGLIHRDIKPSNIWLDAANKGRVKILDFGLARPTNEETETRLTQIGLILGTPAYMSPEQARAQAVDERCDLFSLGCVLYRLCAGKLPFAGQDAMSMLLAIQTEDPPDLQPLNADVPAAFAELIQKLLAKKPADRPESARIVVTAIQSIEREWIAGAKTTSIRPAVRPTKDARSDGETVGAEGVELVDPALEESAITELELIRPETANAPQGTSRGRAWILAALGGAMVAVLSIFCCLGVVLATDHGVIDIVAEDDTARRLVEDAGLKVWDHHNKAHPVKLGANQLKSGGYHFEQAGLPNGLHFDPNPFSLPRGETRTIKITYVTPKPSKPVQPALVEIRSGEAKALQKEWAAFLNRDVVIVNSVNAKLVLIPPGEFTMGSSKEQFAKKIKKESVPEVAAEMPAHRVQITKPFYMGATEVTFDQFKSFVAATSYRTEPAASGKGGTGLDAGKDIGRNAKFDWLNLGPGYAPSKSSPVSNISWRDAQAFCAWLSEREKKTYRLPTEAEWEYACRAGSSELWSFGDDLAQSRNYMWFHLPLKPDKNPTKPQPVAQKKANDFGLFDMHGNVAEMCSDLWSPSYYQRCVKENLVADPKGPGPGRESSRVVRGGSFIEGAQIARSAYRQFLDPTLGHVHVGFRVVCEIPLPE